MSIAARRKTAKLDALAHEIAYCTSRTDIECMCACAGGGPDKGGWWWRIDRVAVKDDRQWVDRAVRYLEARELLERDPGNTNRVRILSP